MAELNEGLHWIVIGRPKMNKEGLGKESQVGNWSASLVSWNQIRASPSIRNEGIHMR
jgi:hypothetical protein